MKTLLTILCAISFNFLTAQFTYLNTTYNPNNTWSIGSSIIEYNGSYYMTGATSDSIAGYQSIFISKIESDGTLNYWKTYGGYPYAHWAGYTNALFSSTSLGELVLAGSRSRPGNGGMATYYNFQINGDTSFTKRYPDTNYLEHTIFYQGKQTNDNGFIFVGVISIQQYDSDILIVKTDQDGNEEWRRHYGKNLTWAIDHGYNVLQTADSGYLVGYYFYIANQVETGNPYMMKVDKLGNYEWEVNLGGPYADLLATACHSNDGNYICASSITDSVLGDYLFTKVNVFKISQDGGIIWSKTIGPHELYNKVHGIYQDHDNGYIMCGIRHEAFEEPYDFSNSRGWICKFDENGDSIWWREYKHFIDPEFNMNHLYDVHLTSDGGYIAVGQTATYYDPQQTWIMKVDSFGCDTPDCQLVGIEEIEDKHQESLQVYPNPASNRVQIDIRPFDKLRTSYQISNTRYQISIYDLFGRKQDEIIIPAGQYRATIDVTSYPAGIYIAVLEDEKRVVGRGKFVVDRH